MSSNSCPSERRAYSIFAVFERLSDWLVHHVISHKRWQLRVVMLATGITFITIPPHFDFMSKPATNRDLVFERQREDLLEPIRARGHDESTVDNNASNILFRWTMPVLAKLLHIRKLGVAILNMISVPTGITLILLLALRHLKDPLAATLATLTYAGTFVAGAGFTQAGFIRFDGISLCFIFLAMLSTRAVPIFLASILACWSNEHAALDCFFVALYWGLIGHESTPRQSYWPSTRVWLPMIAFVSYAIARQIMVSHFHVTQMETKYALSSNPTLLQQLNNSFVGLWSSLEGLWVYVLFSIPVLWRISRKYALCVGGVMFGLFIVGMSSGEITPALFYLAPCIPLAWLALGRFVNINELRTLGMLALMLSLVAPGLAAGSKTVVWMIHPLPVEILHYFQRG